MTKRSDDRADVRRGRVLQLVGVVLIAVFLVGNVAVGLSALPVGLIGGFLVYRGKQYTSKAKARAMFRDDRPPAQAGFENDRPPVIYLRSFSQDVSYWKSKSLEAARIGG